MDPLLCFTHQPARSTARAAPMLQQRGDSVLQHGQHQPLLGTLGTRGRRREELRGQQDLWCEDVIYLCWCALHAPTDLPALCGFDLHDEHAPGARMHVPEQRDRRVRHRVGEVVAAGLNRRRARGSECRDRTGRSAAGPSVSGPFNVCTAERSSVTTRWSTPSVKLPSDGVPCGAPPTNPLMRNSRGCGTPALPPNCPAETGAAAEQRYERRQPEYAQRSMFHAFVLAQQ